MWHHIVRVTHGIPRQKWHALKSLTHTVQNNVLWLDAHCSDEFILTAKQSKKFQISLPQSTQSRQGQQLNSALNKHEFLIEVHDALKKIIAHEQ